MDNQKAIVKRVEIWFWVSLSLFSRRLGIIIQFLQYYNRKQGLKQKYVYYKEHSILCKISNVSDDCSTHLCIWQTSPYLDHFSPSRFLGGSAFNCLFMIANMFSMGTVARKVVVGFEMWEIARECSRIKS